MRLFTLIVLIGASLAAACSATPPADRPIAARECRVAVGIEGSTEIERVLSGIERAEANDALCGPPPTTTRICRALFAVATVDPALLLDRPDDRGEAAHALEWILTDAATVAPSELVEALQAVASLNATIAESVEDHIIADAILERNEPAIVGPIDEYWSSNCQP